MQQIEPFLKFSGDRLADLFIAWRTEKASILKLIDQAIDLFQLSQKDPYFHELKKVAQEAHVPLANPYHNNDHFREVTFSMICLLREHNEKSAIKLLHKDIYICLIAALAHDFGHLGRKNSFHYEQENMAVERLESIASLSGTDLSDLRNMILCTDLSSREKDLGIRKDSKLRLLCDLLLDADIIPSTATTYAFNKNFISKKLIDEKIEFPPLQQSLINFLDKVAGEYKTEAAQNLYSTAKKKLRAELSR